MVVSPHGQDRARLRAGDVIGTVQEGRFTHKIMVPFAEPGEVTLDWIQQGSFTIDTAVARIRDARATADPSPSPRNGRCGNPCPRTCWSGECSSGSIRRSR